MKFRYPPYEGDSIVRPLEDENSTQLNSVDSGLSSAEMVRRDITFAGDYQKIAAEARILRQVAVRDLVGRLWAWLEKSFARAERRRNEALLSKATDHADLERRLRRLERGHAS